MGQGKEIFTIVMRGGSQHSLVVDAKEMRLFAVNAGSNSVSMFTIKPGGITLAGTS